MRFSTAVKRGVAVAVAAVSALLLATGPASAAYDGSWSSTFWLQGPRNSAPDITRPDIIGDCRQSNGGVVPKSCVFMPVNQRIVNSGYKRISDIQNNCNNRYETKGGAYFRWSTEKSVTVGSSTTYSGGGAVIGKFFKAALDKATSYSNSKTTAEAYDVNDEFFYPIPAGYNGWLEMNTILVEVGGWMDVSYKSRIFNHYNWYYPGRGSDAVKWRTSVLLPNGRPDGTIRAIVQKCGGHRSVTVKTIQVANL